MVFVGCIAPLRPPLTPESQPTATVPSAPANQHYLDFSSVHRAVERYADNASQTSCRQSLFSQIRMAVSGCSLSTSRLAPACHVSSTDSVSVQRGAYLTVPDGDPAARGASHTVVYRHNAESWPELLPRVGWRDREKVSLKLQACRLQKTSLISYASHKLTQSLKIVAPSDMMPGMICRGLDSPDLRTWASCRVPSRSHPPRQPPLVVDGRPQRGISRKAAAATQRTATGSPNNEERRKG